MPRSPPPSAATSSSSAAVIVAVIISAAVFLSGAVYLLLRLLSRRRRRRTFSVVDDVITTNRSAATSSSPPLSSSSLIAALPSFKFGAGAGTLTGGDCAVCLGKFETSDLLRLLPLCCHAFHAPCVDTWLLSNATCPLCRSTVTPTESDLLDKILSLTENRTDSRERSNSFRVEIGSISRRRRDAASDSARSYSVGEFDYIIDDSYSYEVPIESVNNNKFAPSAPPEIPPEELAAAVGGGRSWLREYVDRLSSVSSGRFFTGSSRRSETPGVEEAERVGEEISELFRWLSGV